MLKNLNRDLHFWGHEIKGRNQGVRDFPRLAVLKYKVTVDYCIPCLLFFSHTPIFSPRLLGKQEFLIDC